MKSNRWLIVIAVLSIVLPLLVGILIFSSLDIGLKGEWLCQIPFYHAWINGLAAILLIIALVAIKNKKVTLHKSLMVTCFFLGVFFLVTYVLYHGNTESTVFGDLNHDYILDEAERVQVGIWRLVYLVLLLSHIALSMAVVPVVLMAFYFAFTDQIARHRKIVRFAYPIWLYVSITGVLIYLMIQPYYLC